MRLPPIGFKISAPLRTVCFDGSYRATFPDEAPSERWVYFAQGTDAGPIKIGQTINDPRRRIAKLQSGYPFGVLQLVGLVRGDACTEREIHRLFRACRLAGEWFEATPELVSYIHGLPVAS